MCLIKPMVGMESLISSMSKGANDFDGLNLVAQSEVKTQRKNEP